MGTFLIGMSRKTTVEKLEQLLRDYGLGDDLAIDDNYGYTILHYSESKRVVAKGGKAAIARAIATFVEGMHFQTQWQHINKLKRKRRKP
jgi:hypothetical protein